MNRVYNFYAGPAVLPQEVMKKAQSEFIDWHGSGMSVMEMSHRSKDFDSIIKGAESKLRKIMNIPDNYKVLFLQGGARTQFGMIPLNILPDDKSADYLITGNWAKHAYKEVLKIGKKANIVCSSEDSSFNHIPDRDSWELDPNAAYIHYTSNNTVYGTQFRELPEFENKNVVCDMSSDILSRPVDISKFGIIYAGAQKNAGPSGVTIVIIREDLLNIEATKNLPTMSIYKDIAAKDSMLNTPPCFSIYMVGLVLAWVESIGGLEEMEKRNKKKASLIYNAIDNSNGFFKGFSNKKDRSLMNVTFKLPNEELDSSFIKEAEKRGLIGIKGYRTLGGIRASIYNAHPIEGIHKLVELMEEFKNKN